MGKPDHPHSRSYVGEMEDWDGESTDMFEPYNPYISVCDDWFRNCVKEGIMKNDLAQLRVAYRMQKVQDILNTYKTNQGVRLYRKKQDYYKNIKSIRETRLKHLKGELAKIDQEQFEEEMQVLRIDPQRQVDIMNARRQVEEQIAQLERQLKETFSARNVDAAIVESDDEGPGDDDPKDETDKGVSSSNIQSTAATLSKKEQGPKVDEEAAEVMDDSNPPKIPRGFYLHGPVGTGKSLLMNALFMNTDIQKKMRFHMNDFLRDIHKRLHALQNPTNPKAIAVARQFAKEYTLIYIDEFQLIDVADAVLVQQIFQEMFRLGTILLATSNRSPESLAANQFDPVKPVVDLITKHCIIQEIQSTKDYRKELFEETLVADDETKITKNYYIKTPEDDFRIDIDYYFRQLLGPEIEESEEKLSLASNRTLSVKTYRKHDILIVKCQFSDLCDNRYLGEVDFRAFAKQVDALVLYDIPTLSDETDQEANRTRRFITLIDTLYDWRRPVMCTAVEEPTRLFKSCLLPPTTTTDMAVGDILDRYESTTTQGHPVGASVNVQDISFAFARTASRLMELTSATWWRNVYEYFDFEER